MGQIPTVDEWTKRRSGIKTPESTLAKAGFDNLDTLVICFSTLRAAEDLLDKKLLKAVIAVRITFAATYLLKITGSETKKETKTTTPNLPPKTHLGPLDEDQRKLVIELRDAAIEKWCKFFEVDKPSEQDLASSEYIWTLIYQEGVGLTNQADKEAKIDENARKAGMPWMEADKDRVRYKARFRNGLIWRCKSVLAKDQIEYELYDSHEHNDLESEHSDNFVHFAMDQKGRLYVGYIKDDYIKFFHSAFTGGDNVLCAGIMEVVKGQVKTVKNASGHYLPQGINMVTFLHRLLSYGVDLKQVIIAHWVNEKLIPAYTFMSRHGYEGDVRTKEKLF